MFSKTTISRKNSKLDKPAITKQTQNRFVLNWYLKPVRSVTVNVKTVNVFSKLVH